MLEILTGTSGFAYKEWKGSFYPEKLANDKMLAYYAERFPTVEINNTFYRLPSASLLERWAEETPDSFSFVLKASRKITHRKDIDEACEALLYLLKTTQSLGEKMGPLLFQFPPYLKKSLSRLGRLLELVPEDRMAACEFRHESWLDEEVYDFLRDHGAALVAADNPKMETPLVATTNWGYLRMRREGYSDEDLGGWVKQVRAQDWGQVYGFFKHEDEGAGPEMAKRFAALFEM